jgi:4-hydroxy-tetrahydrodipicolinate reductase
MTGVDPGPPLRVAQWATGNIGSRALREIIDHPGMDLVAVHVHSPDKVGVDAGDLCGAPPAGVAATDDLEHLVGLAPDAIVHTARSLDVDAVCRVLEAGIDVVTTRGELHNPARVEDDVRERIEAACVAGGSSIHSTGSSPGFITEAVPLVLTSIQRRLDRLAIEESADLSRRDSPDLLFSIMGFGRRPGPMGEARAAHLRDAFGPSLELVAESLGLPLDELTADGEVAVARTATTIAAGTIEAGTVAAQRVSITGWRDGQPLLSFTASWYCTTDVDPAWDLRPTGWRVQVDGDAPLDVELRFPVPLERMAETSPGYTANRAVNAVPLVCAAAPGIRTSLDLPQVVARLG